jgi:hypothetical protein
MMQVRRLRRWWQCALGLRCRARRLARELRYGVGVRRAAAAAVVIAAAPSAPARNPLPSLCGCMAHVQVTSYKDKVVTQQKVVETPVVTTQNVVVQVSSSLSNPKRWRRPRKDGGVRPTARRPAAGRPHGRGPPLALGLGPLPGCRHRLATVAASAAAYDTTQGGHCFWGPRLDCTPLAPCRPRNHNWALNRVTPRRLAPTCPATDPEGRDAGSGGAAAADDVPNVSRVRHPARRAAGADDPGEAPRAGGRSMRTRRPRCGSCRAAMAPAAGGRAVSGWRWAWERRLRLWGMAAGGGLASRGGDGALVSHALRIAGARGLGSKRELLLRQAGVGVPGQAGSSGVGPGLTQPISSCCTQRVRSAAHGRQQAQLQHRIRRQGQGQRHLRELPGQPAGASGGGARRRRPRGGGYLGGQSSGAARKLQPVAAGAVGLEASAPLRALAVADCCTATVTFSMGSEAAAAGCVCGQGRACTCRGSPSAPGRLNSKQLLTTWHWPLDCKQPIKHTSH